MNEAIRDEWVTALRSGDYVQGQGALRETGETGKVSYCCLGVLCDIAVKHEITQLSHVDDYGNAFYGNPATDELSSAFLPNNVMSWAGIENPSTDFGGQESEAVRGRDEDGEGRAYFSLVDLNDSGYSFDFIADVIAERF